MRLAGRKFQCVVPSVVLRPGFFDAEFTLPPDRPLIERLHSLFLERGEALARREVYNTLLGPVRAEEFERAYKEVARPQGHRRSLLSPWGGVPWKKLGVVAAVLGFPGECLVDEERYFRGWPCESSVARKAPRAAGYRILFEIQRRGMTVEDFLQKSSVAEEIWLSSRPGCQKWWRAAWWVIFTGKPFAAAVLPPGDTHARGDYEKAQVLLPLSYYVHAFRHGQEVFGDAFYRLLFTPVKRIPPGICGALAGAIVELGRKELAFLAGAARLLCGYRAGELGGEDSLRGEFEKLLGWYLGEEKEGGSRDAPGAARARSVR